VRNLGVLISGRGSNMAAIIDQVKNGQLNANIAVVISNKPTAKGLLLAAEHGIKTHVFDPKSFDTQDAYEQAIVDCLQASGVELVVLAGYMKLVGDPLLTTYKDRMVNIHPSLLPSFKGLNAQQQALDYGVKITGCTVHYVTKEMDAGPIILQAAVPVFDDDDVDSLSQRILTEEHRIFSVGIQQVLATF
jgi:phosphoribosylglycinamide formyltransferase-1